MTIQPVTFRTKNPEIMFDSGANMISVRIGDNERDLAEADEQWVNQQIKRRRADGQTVCVSVTIREKGLNLVLFTPTCGERGGGRLPNPQEKEIFDLWESRGLNDENFTGGNLVAFLKQLRHLL
jgi:hypothetical protein